MKSGEKKTERILAVLGILPVIWIALLIAPYVKGGLPEIMQQFTQAINEPFHIVICEDSVKTVLIFLSS